MVWSYYTREPLVLKPNETFSKVFGIYVNVLSTGKVSHTKTKVPTESILQNAHMQAEGNITSNKFLSIQNIIMTSPISQDFHKKE